MRPYLPLLLLFWLIDTGNCDAQNAPGTSVPVTVLPAAPNSKKASPAPPDSKPQSPAPDKSGAIPDHVPPAVVPSIPTITDTAQLTAPGWLECDFSPLKNLDRDRLLSTPLLLKLTARNRRLQFRAATDGYLRQGDGTDGLGDSYLGGQYLFATQERTGFDLATRLTLKMPTQPAALSGTGKVDYNLLFLASRDFTKWQFHGDFNLGVSSLSRQNGPGVDQQLFVSASTNTPLRGDLWTYMNEATYTTGISGTKARVTTMQAISYNVHRYEVYSLGLQWQPYGDGATFQVVFGASFFLSKVF